MESTVLVDPEVYQIVDRLVAMLGDLRQVAYQ
jgi:hypothetical protein